jgi:TolB-like protein
MADRAESENPSRPAEATAGSARRVFLSYASHDAAVAQKVCSALEAAGFPCWIAPRDVRPGAEYADAIVGAINEAKAMVLVLSQSAMESSHVAREVERAASKHKSIIAFRTDTAALNRALEYFLSNSQWIDVAALGMPAALKKLVEAVGSAATNAVDPVVSEKTPARADGKVKLLVAAAVVLAGGAVVALGFHFWSSTHGGPQVPAVAAISDKSIAVLPFADMSEKKDQEYFADGIAEEVLDRLAKVPGLKVVGRASSFQFKGKNTDPAKIGVALGAAYLLEGSVRRETGRVRVAAQLIDARTGSERWSDRFDSDVVDMLQVQETIAAELARALQVAVEVDTGPRFSIKSTEAFDAYLRGVHSFDRYSQEGAVAAVADFQHTLTLDPTFAPAATGLAKTYALIGSMGWLPIRTAFERAREAALLAQRLDPKSSSPHVVLAQIHVEHDFDWAGADRELQQAFTLGPRDSYGAEIATELAGALGHWDEGRQLGIEAIALDPLNADAHFVLGYHIYMRSGRLAEAEQSIRRVLQINPGYGTGHYYLGEVLMLEGHNDAALAEFRKETPDDGQAVGCAMILFATGRKAESDAQLAEAIRQNETDWPEGIASVYAFRGEKDRAIEWLDRAYDARDHLYLLKGNLLFKNLAGDPRYKAFLRKMNLPE